MKVFKYRETLKEWYSEHTEHIHHLDSTVNILLRLLSHIFTHPSIQACATRESPLIRSLEDLQFQFLFLPKEVWLSVGI